MMTRTIRTGIAVAALLIAPIAAQAADLRQPSYKAPAYSAPSYSNWTGFYVGLNGGYGFGKSNWDFPAVSVSPKGLLAGVTVGYNFQTGTWLWGVEADADYSGMKGSVDCGFGTTCETKNSWLATARARLGYAGWNNWLPYITGGGAMGDIKATNVFGTANKAKIGWTAGAGTHDQGCGMGVSVPAGATTVLVKNLDGERIVGRIGWRARDRGGIDATIDNGQTVNKGDATADAVGKSH